MRRFVSIGRLDGVPIHVHWTLVVASAVLILASLSKPIPVLFAIASYFVAMLVHEWGHVVFARKRKCLVFGIELYPLLGLTRFQTPRTRFDHCVIAWGGVIFQGIAGFPMVAWIKLVGYTPFEFLNAFLAIFGFLAVVMVPLNLAPIPPLDGATAWGIVPLLIRRFRNERGRARSSGWNTPR